MQSDVTVACQEKANSILSAAWDRNKIKPDHVIPFKNSQANDKRLILYWGAVKQEVLNTILNVLKSTNVKFEGTFAYKCIAVADNGSVNVAGSKTGLDVFDDFYPTYRIYLPEGYGSDSEMKEDEHKVKAQARAKAQAQ